MFCYENWKTILTVAFGNYHAGQPNNARVMSNKIRCNRYSRNASM